MPEWGHHPGGAVRIGEIVMDVHDLDRCGRFWSALLGVGIKSENARYLVLEPQPGGIGLILQHVPEKKWNKNRVHLDLRVKDFDAALIRVQELGGHFATEVIDPEERFLVVTDPEGNEFCLVKQEA
jgi:predicted enzyme related to lactoylglutathione lyase